MIDTILLEETLANLFPADVQGSEEKRQIFKAGLQWGIAHPYFDKGCPNRVWHYLLDDPTDLPEFNKICLIKFRDGSGSLSSLVQETDDLSEFPSKTDDVPPTKGVDHDAVGQKKWVTKYRDDIIAWSYYIMN